ncbi:MAG: phosphonate metabolism transcriptional regulator PhnF [Marivibrio sp.]|uniref:phosphonate metabolism transcriptional regulator PhnF n=1 Tax=Marivibrio sp. TaxID=2039719 RepID=UPI0032ED1294
MDGGSQDWRTREGGPGQSVWARIAQRIEGDIRDGVYPRGERMPPESALAARFSVNRHTLRRAMAALAERGLVRIEQGRGTFVQEETIEYPIGSRTRFSQNIAEAERLPGHRILRAEEAPADRAVARNLSVRVGAPVVVLEAVSVADGRPLGYGLHYLPAKRFRGIAAIYRETGSLTASLARMGVADYSRLSTRVTAQMPSREIAALLEQPITRPVLQTEKIDVDADGRAVAYGLTRFAADRVQLVVEPFRETDEIGGAG